MAGGQRAWKTKLCPSHSLDLAVPSHRRGLSVKRVSLVAPAHMCTHTHTRRHAHTHLAVCSGASDKYHMRPCEACVRACVCTCMERHRKSEQQHLALGAPQSCTGKSLLRTTLSLPPAPGKCTESAAWELHFSELQTLKPDLRRYCPSAKREL